MISTVKKTSPLAWVPTVYFAMGLPFVVLNMVSAVMFKDMGISDARIAFWTSLIMWPWTIKFLWSPFLEIFRTKKFFVVTTQLLSGVLFGLAALALHMFADGQNVANAEVFRRINVRTFDKQCHLFLS